MMEYVGIGSAHIYTSEISDLKRQLLLFDRVGLFFLDVLTAQFSIREEDEHILADLEWLKENGLIYDQSIPVAPGEPHEFEQFKAANYASTEDLSAIAARIIAARLSQADDIRALPIQRPSLFSQRDEGLRQDLVCQVVIDQFPLLPESTSWEDIQFLRNDTDLTKYRSGLRSAIRKLADLKFTAAEIADEIEFNLNAYKSFLTAQEFKYSLGSWESIFYMGSELLEDAIRLQPNKVATTILKITSNEIMLHEEELTAPGRELAYIVKLEQNLNP